MKEIQLISGERIPYGFDPPTKDDEKILIKLGFNLADMVKADGVYYITVPDTLDNIRCVQEMPENTVPPYHVDYKVYYDDLLSFRIEKIILDDNIHTLLASGERILYGSNPPNDRDAKLFTQLGFDLADMVKIDEKYYLTVPDTVNIRCVKVMPKSTTKPYTIEYEVYYGGLKCFSKQERFFEENINTNNPLFISGFYVNNIAIALNQNAEMLEIDLPSGSKVPYGHDIPAGRSAELLIKLGFDLKNIWKMGKLYYLTLPKTSEIRCVKLMPNFENDVATPFRVQYKLYYKGVEFFSQSQAFCSIEDLRTDSGYCHLEFYLTSAEVALAEDAESQRRRCRAHPIDPSQYRYRFWKSVPDDQGAGSSEMIERDAASKSCRLM